MRCVHCRLATGQLFEVISNRDHFDELEAASCIDQLLDVVQYLHNCRIAHLDVKVGGSTAWTEIRCEIRVIDFVNSKFENNYFKLLLIVCHFFIFSSLKLLRNWSTSWGTMHQSAVFNTSVHTSWLNRRSGNQMSCILFYCSALSQACVEIVM